MEPRVRCLAARTCSLTVGQSLVAGGGGCVGSSVDMSTSQPGVGLGGVGQSPSAASPPTLMAVGMDDIGGLGAVQISNGGPRSLGLSSISGAAAGTPALQVPALQAIAPALAALPMYRGTAASAPDLLWGGNPAGRSAGRVPGHQRVLRRSGFQRSGAQRGAQHQQFRQWRRDFGWVRAGTPIEQHDVFQCRHGAGTRFPGGPGSRAGWYRIVPPAPEWA